MTECWVHPALFWERRAGDCEDHAILIVSMLRTLGINAWLVWGMFDSGLGATGHAWVEAEIDGMHYLIEGTSKPPLPDVFPGVACGDLTSLYDSQKYHPQALFNRNPDGPARTNGKEYSRWQDNHWLSMPMVDPDWIPAKKTHNAELVTDNGRQTLQPTLASEPDPSPVT
jgi:hypothetical protein